MMLWILSSVVAFAPVLHQQVPRQIATRLVVEEELAWPELPTRATEKPWPNSHRPDHKKSKTLGTGAGFVPAFRFQNGSVFTERYVPVDIIFTHLKRDNRPRVAIGFMGDGYYGFLPTNFEEQAQRVKAFYEEYPETLSKVIAVGIASPNLEDIYSPPGFGAVCMVYEKSDDVVHVQRAFDVGTEPNDITPETKKKLRSLWNELGVVVDMADVDGGFDIETYDFEGDGSMPVPTEALDNYFRVQTTLADHFLWGYTKGMKTFRELNEAYPSGLGPAYDMNGYMMAHQMFVMSLLEKNEGKTKQQQEDELAKRTKGFEKGSLKYALAAFLENEEDLQELRESNMFSFEDLPTDLTNNTQVLDFLASDTFEDDDGEGNPFASIISQIRDKLVKVIEDAVPPVQPERE